MFRLVFKTSLRILHIVKLSVLAMLVVHHAVQRLLALEKHSVLSHTQMQIFTIRLCQISVMRRMRLKISDPKDAALPQSHHLQELPDLLWRYFLFSKIAKTLCELLIHDQLIFNFANYNVSCLYCYWKFS